jgi:hypothetical protein
MASNLVQQCSQYLTDGDSVDARHCEKGSMARDIKSGGVRKLRTSIVANGYSNVRIINACTNAFTHMYSGRTML